jgi:hypothetical protein
MTGVCLLPGVVLCYLHHGAQAQGRVAAAGQLGRCAAAVATQQHGTAAARGHPASPTAAAQAVSAVQR